MKPLRLNMASYTFALVLALAVLPLVFAQSTRTNAAGEWRTYNHDPANTRFSPLSQINTSNVARLKEAWVYRPSATGGRPSAEATPIVVNGVMYLTAGNRVVALEPETGKEIWRNEVQNGQPSQRGVAYWPGDRDHPPRILFTAGRRLMALNAVTGEAPLGFGTDGGVDMTVGYGGVPTIFRNVAMVGAAVGEYIPLGPPGDSRGFDVRDGKKVWDFHSVPRPGEVGHETWEGDSWNANTGDIAWQVTVGVTDELPEGKRNTGRHGLAGPIVTGGGLVFLGATNDNRFRAFDAKTGKELWAVKLDYAANAIPITYQAKNGKQYVAVMSGGGASTGAPPNGQGLIVFALP